MIDYRLAVSVLIAYGAGSLLARRWSITGFDGPVGFSDVAAMPAVLGVVVARLVAVALDDPASLTRLSSLLIVRSGVEFWPGALAAAVALVWPVRRDAQLASTRLVSVVPPALVAHAVFLVTCVVRDGCFGPIAELGLRPPGLRSRMVPVELLMGVALAAAVVCVRRALPADHHRPSTIVIAYLAVLGAVRGVGSFWLPHVGAGLTRAHETSLVVAFMAAVVLGVALVQHHWAVDPARGRS